MNLLSKKCAMPVNCRRLSMPRYARQRVLQEIGDAGQELLKRKQVGIIGLGALGSVAAELLVRAGIGTVLLIDRDIVEKTNLHRQFLYGEADTGKAKVDAAQERLQSINSEVTVLTQAIHLDTSNLAHLDSCDIFLDCTDNIRTRFLINDYCRKKRKPWVHAAAISTKGTVFPVLPDGPCLRCFLPENAQGTTCRESGVLNTLTATVAALQATKCIQLLLGNRVTPKLYHISLWEYQTKKLTIKKRPTCKTCIGVYPSLTQKATTTTIHFCGSTTYQFFAGKNLKKTEEKGIKQFPDGRVLITADSLASAETKYSKFIGN
jgi:molybdopterin-synthase adenylyltransferase